MPNHLHEIIINVGADLRVCPKNHSPKHTEHGGEYRFGVTKKNGEYIERNENHIDKTYKKGEHTGSPLPKIVQWFKTMTTSDTF